jgi:hypothetical protein
LTVKSHTVIHQDGRPNDTKVAAGTSATFRCDAESDQSLPLHVDWFADGDLIDFDRDHRFVKLHDNSLVIDKILALMPVLPERNTTTQLPLPLWSCKMSQIVLS